MSDRRLDPDTLTVLKQAAEERGRSVEQLLVAVARDAARQIIEQRRIIKWNRDSRLVYWRDKCSTLATWAFLVGIAGVGFGVVGIAIGVHEVFVSPGVSAKLDSQDDGRKWSLLTDELRAAHIALEKSGRDNNILADLLVASRQRGAGLEADLSSARTALDVNTKENTNLANDLQGSERTVANLNAKLQVSDSKLDAVQQNYDKLATLSESARQTIVELNKKVQFLASEKEISDIQLKLANELKDTTALKLQTVRQEKDAAVAKLRARVEGDIANPHSMTGR